MQFSRQEYWGCIFLLQGIFLTYESNPWFLHWQADSLPLSSQGSLFLILSLLNLKVMNMLEEVMFVEQEEVVEVLS